MLTPGQHDPHLALVTVNPVRTGGMQTFTRELVRAVLGGGWRVTLALAGEDIYQDLVPQARRQPTIEPVDWLDETCAGDRSYRWRTIMNRRRWFRRIQPDVVLFVQSSNTPYRASIVGAYLAGIPIVTTQRTLPWPVDDVPSRNHLFGLIRGIGLHRRQLVRKTWLTATLARRIVFNSQAVRYAYEREYLYPPHKGCVIVNAADSSLTAPLSGGPASNAPNRPITIGYIGRLGWEKRVDLPIRAMAALRTRRAARLRIYGDGPDRAKLVTLAEKLDVADRVTFCGPTNDIKSVLSQLDVFVMCSDRESSSNAVLEAMAASKAVVVTRVGGLPELIDNGRGGLCVPPGDVSALAAALSQLIDDETLRARSGERARQVALTRHDPQTVADAWRQLLAEVARSPRGRRAPAASRPIAAKPIQSVLAREHGA